MYLIWGILPFCLLMMTIWSLLKPLLKVKGNDSPMYYFKGFLFTSVVMVISVFIHKQSATSDLVDYVSFGHVQLDLVAIFIYPLFLVIGAQISDFIKR